MGILQMFQRRKIRAAFGEYLGREIIRELVSSAEIVQPVAQPSRSLEDRWRAVGHAAVAVTGVVNDIHTGSRNGLLHLREGRNPEISLRLS
jgi:hypothetical protein